MSDVTYVDRGWAAILSSVARAGSTEVRVGVVGQAAEQQHPGSNLSIAEVAMINEYGTRDGHVPERSWLRDTFRKRVGLLRQMFAQAARSVCAGAPAQDELERAGERMAEEVRRTIESGVAPHNAPATEDKKGFDHPLVETEVLLGAIGHEIAPSSSREGGAPVGDLER